MQNLKSNEVYQSVPGPITVLSNGELTNKFVYRTRVWLPVCMIDPYIPSGDAWVNALTSLYDHPDRFFWKNGKKYTVPDIGKLFGEYGGKWIKNLQKEAEDGSGPLRYSPMYERLRIVNAYCQLVFQEGWLPSDLSE